MKDSLGGKPIICHQNQPMFAELAILNVFLADGWQARWVETYARPRLSPKLLSNWHDDAFKTQKHSPITDERITGLLDRIANANQNSFAGCWDVLAWKDDQILFAESKRSKKDKIRQTQINWLAAALKTGLTANNFLVVQWDFE